MLWIGTARGLYVLEGLDADPAPVPLPTPDPMPLIERVVEASTGAPWVATAYHGVWTRRVAGADQAWQRAFMVRPVTDLAMGYDNTPWVGSQVGLFRWNTSSNQWLNYAEEGTANLGIPDNIVERVIAPGDASVWVFMPEAVSIFEAGGQHDQKPREFSYIGRPGLSITHVEALGDGSYILTKDEGLVLLRALPGHTHAEELREVYEQAHVDGALRLKDSVLNVPASMRDAVPSQVARAGDVLWFGSKAGLWPVALDALTRDGSTPAGTAATR